MTDEEITEALAEKFLRWKRGNAGTDSVSVWVWFDVNGNMEYVIDSFDPIIDPAACALVLDEIERRGWAWGWSSDTRICTFYIYRRAMGGSERLGRAEDPGNRYRAVCLAALRALGVEI